MNLRKPELALRKNEIQLERGGKIMKNLSNAVRAASVVLSLAFLLGSFQVGLAGQSPKQLAVKVQNAIGRYYAEPFNVTIRDDGIVHIQGQVNTLYDKLRIFDIVSKVRGVKDIEDALIVNTPTLPNDMIEANVRDQLMLVSSILEPNRIKVRVDNGIVFLSGKVSFQRERIAAETATSWQKGVKGIVDNITVMSPKKARSDQNLTAVLHDVMRDQFPLEKKVAFSVNKGVVTVTGNCSTLWAKRMIAKEFSRVTGIRKVINRLKVVPIIE